MDRSESSVVWNVVIVVTQPMYVAYEECSKN